MHPYPHTYVASARAEESGTVAVSSPELADIETAAPPQFDGPGGLWSPEELLCAAVADCFILTFRSVSRAARLPWTRLDCRVEGILDRVERRPEFTRFTTFAVLTVPAGADTAKARTLLERAEQSCLVSNSLRSARTLDAQVQVAAAEPVSGG